jgi:lipoprotein-anchoring transpeptidase ErfK/SrfK
VRTLIAGLALSLAFPAIAAAQDPKDPPVPNPTPSPVPGATQPAHATLTVRTTGTLADGNRSVAVSGRSFGFSGTLSPYVKGERVALTLLRDGKAVRHLHPRMHRGANGRSATFAVTVDRRTPGTYRVRAVHPRSDALTYARARSDRVHVVAADIRSGHGGAAVRLLQRGLRRLHYAAPHSGVYDAATGRAVMAWRKVTHRARLYTADRGVLLGVLDGQGAWKVRHPHDGHHVEADISLQVLALVDGSKVVRIEHMSSGKPSTPTVLGKFRVYRKSPGTNSEGMVDSSYFIRGYAIHGYASVPTYNASHGCLRVPIPDAAAIYNWVQMGDVVWVEP